MLVNLSNHPSAKWDNKQKQTAEKSYGHIADMPFPAIDPFAPPGQITQLANSYLKNILDTLNSVTSDTKPHAVHIQGEFTFVCKLVTMLKQAGITCVASTTTRNVTENENGEKTVKFNFVQFREY